MKKLTALALAFVLILAGCSGGAAPSAQSSGAAAPPSQASGGAAEPASQGGSEAEALAAPGPYGEKVAVADPSYNEMTAEELYELAKSEGGKITVYCITSKISKIVESFRAEYPDLEIESYDMKTSEVLERIPLEYDTKNITSDVIITSDANGEIYYNWYDAGYVEAYYPTAICDTIAPGFLEYGLTLYNVADLWYYNAEAFPQGSPINNWWDMFDQDESGNYKYIIYIKDIASDATYLAMFSQLVLMSEEMEAAYQEKHGAPLEYTYDAEAVGVEPNNAGYEFLYRFAQANVSLISDGDERVAAVAATTADKPGIANATGSKMAYAMENNWEQKWILDLAPFATIVRPTNIYLTGGSDNPAGARLFIYYVMGADDPTNNAGLGALLNYGCWTPRSDYVDTTNDVMLGDIDYVTPNMSGIYDTYLDVSDFWVYWKDKF